MPEIENRFIPGNGWPALFHFKPGEKLTFIQILAVALIQ